MTNFERTYEIPAHSRSVVDAQLAKLNKRARKLQLEELSWTFSSPKIGTKSGSWILELTVSGPQEVKFAGWQFIATLQHIEGETIVRSATGETIPAEYKEHSRVGVCDHCKINRYRKDTFILKNEDSNAIVQVGSSCIKDFLGGNSPDQIVGQANFVRDLYSFLDEMGQGASGPSGDALSKFIPSVIATIRKYGWVSKTRANETGEYATATRILNGDGVFVLASEHSDYINGITDDDLIQSNVIIDWAENLSDDLVNNADSDYLHNLRAIARIGFVDKRTAGIAASMVPAYKRAHDKPKGTSEYIGVLKVRDTFTLTLKRHLSFSGAYGTTHKFIFEDVFGNVVTWNSSNPPSLNEGEEYQVTGSVKKHSVYREVKQTELTRCKIA